MPRKIPDNLLRKRIGIIFALPQVLPISIYQNIAYGPKVHGITNKAKVDQIVEESLKKAYLWDEVKDRLDLQANRALGRPAAAAVHCTDAGGRARGDPLRRAVFGPGPDLHGQGRGRHAETQGPIHADTGDQQHQAGGAGQRPHGVFPDGRTGGTRATPTRSFTSPKDTRTDDYVTGRFG